jgi:hypothetical protein
MQTIRWAALSAAVVIACAGCGPSAPDVMTVVSQTMQAQSASILSQVDWKQVMTALEGKVGPRTRIVAEGYIKQSAGVEILIDGGELQFRTQASGTGGRDNSALMPELLQIQQRWERADDSAKANRQKWTQEVVDALIRYEERKTSSQPSVP